MAGTIAPVAQPSVGAAAPPSAVADETATPAATPGQVGGAPGSGAPDISTLIKATVDGTPELANQPGAVVSVASSGGDVKLKGNAVAAGGNRQALATAAKQSQQSGGLFGFIEHGVGDLIHKVGQYANDGLSTVQQEWRYLHDVEARHGRGAALEEGLGILLGAAAGTVLDPGEGTILGAEGAARLEGAITYTDSWKRAANPNYRDPHTGQLVSFGRDVAGVLGIKGEGTLDKVVSGGLDTAFDFGLDPVAAGGSIVGEAHSVEGIEHGLLSQVYTGISTRDPEVIDQAYSTLPSVRRAFQTIADSGPTDIVKRFGPAYQSMANELAAAKTPEEVLDVFHDYATSRRIMDADRLPTLSLTRTATGKFHDIARNAGDGVLSELPVVGGLAHRIATNKIVGIRTWADRLEALPGKMFKPDEMDFSGKQLDIRTTRGLGNVYALARYGNSDRVATTVSDAFAAASVAQRKVIYRNLIFDTLFHMSKMDVPGEDEYLKALQSAGSRADIENALQVRGAGSESILTELGKGDVVKAVRERLENHLDAANIDGVGPDREYGFDGKRSIQGIELPDGSTVQVGITKNQTGMLSIPNIVEARRMAEAIRSTKVHRVLAGIDDFGYDHITQGFFKPLILMSGGYGFHISMAEFIPNALRHGLLSTSKGLYDRALANLGYRFETSSDDDVHGLAGFLWDMGGERAYRNSDDAQTLANWWVMNDGNRAPVGLAAGTALEGETDPVLRAKQGLHNNVNAVPGRTTDDWALFGDGEKRFTKMWRQWLRSNARDDWTRTGAKVYLDAGKRGLDEKAASEEARKAVADHLRTESQDVLDDHVRSTGKRPGAPRAWDNIDDWAGSIVDNMKGSVHARPLGNAKELGAANPDVLASLANGHTPDLADLNAIDTTERPLMVPGRLLAPEGGSIVNTIANWGFKKVLDPMVNMISRNQEFAVELIQARRAMDAQVAMGIKSEDEAMVEAASVATIHSMRFVHNLNDRTQWTATMRNFAPFYFAQEQAYRRMGRLLAEDPGAFRRYQMMIAGIGNYTAKLQDGDGNQYIAFPGSGFAGKGLADAMGLHGLTLGGISPASFGGSFASANVVFPLSQGARPDLGPLAVLPMSGLYSMFQELGKSYADVRPVTNLASSGLSEAMGSETMSEPIWQQLIPNAFAANLVTAFSNDRSFQSSIMQAYQFADYQQGQATDLWIKDGRKGPAPQIIPAPNASAAIKQRFADQVKNWARALYLARAVSALISPVSSDVVINNLGFPNELNQAISKAGSVNLGMQQFLIDHPNATPWTVSESYLPSDTNQSVSSGYSLSSSVPAETWIEQNQPLINQYGTAAYWLMPQLTNEQYSPTVYNEQIAQGQRVKDTPEEFLNAIYTAAGDNTYYAGLTIHESALAAMGSNSQAKDAEYSNWNNYVATLQKQNPVWAETYFSAAKQTNSQQVIQGLTTMFQKGDAPAGPQTNLVAWLLGQYEAAAADYGAAGQGTSYSTEQYAQSQVNDNWIQYLDGVETSTPALKPIIQSVFKDALTVET
jgi:hypothetical protein